MAVGTGGGQPSSSSSTLHTLLRAAIAVQVLLLLEYFLDFTPHTHTTAGHQKRAAQRHYHGGVTVGETISDEQRPRDRRNSVDGQQGAGGDMSATLGSDDNGVIVGGGQGEGRRRGGAASERFVDKSVTSQRRQRTDDEKGGMGRPSPLSRAELCLGARMPWDPSTWRQGGTEGIDELLLPPSLAASSSSSSYLRRRRRLFTAAHQRPKSSNAAAAVSPAARAAARARERKTEQDERKAERVAQHAALAAEDEQRSVGPRLSWCERESAGGRARGDEPTPEQVELARCVLEPHRCRLPRGRLQELAASAMPGFRRLDDPLPCLFANGMTCPINTTVRNLETGWAYNTVPFDLPTPDRDPVGGGSTRYKTCAVVGNGGGVMSSPDNGAVIDAHEAVFRFNDMLRLNCLDPNSPNRVLCNDTLLSAPEAVADNIRSGGNRTASAAAAVAEGAHSLTAEELIKADDAKYIPFTGQRTTYRVLNKKHALKLQALGRSVAPGAGPRFVPAPGEAFLLWHYALVGRGAALAREFPDNRMYYLSTNVLNWQMETYSALRRDLYALGLGPFPCYSALSSGLHGIFLAMRMCETVNLFGFSIDLPGVATRVHFRPIVERPSAAHSWAFDTLLLRLLDLSGRVNLCTA